MTLAEVWELRPAGSNPCRHVERFKEQARNRYLDEEELGRLGAAMREMVGQGNLSPSAANAVRLLLLTGARLNEILTARWEWVHRDRCVLAFASAPTWVAACSFVKAMLPMFPISQQSNQPIQTIHSSI